MQNSGTGNVTLNKAGPGTVTLQGAVPGFIAFGSLGGASTISAPHADLTLNALNGRGVQVGFLMTGTVGTPQVATGPISVACFNLNMFGQTASSVGQGTAKIGHGNPQNAAATSFNSTTAASTITVNAGGDITMQGGQRQSMAWIGHGSLSAAGAVGVCNDHVSDQLGNITVSAGRNLNMSIVSHCGPPIGCVTSFDECAWIGHGSQGGGVAPFASIAQITGNISVTTGCDLVITNNAPIQDGISDIIIGHGSPLQQPICNINGDIDINCGRDLTITWNTVEGPNNDVYLGHVDRTVANMHITGNERIRVGRDLTINKTAPSSSITLGFGRNSGQPVPVINGEFELLVNRNMSISSNILPTVAGTEIFIGVFTADTTGFSNTFVAVGGNITWQAAEANTGIEGAELPGMSQCQREGILRFLFYLELRQMMFFF